MRHAVGTIAAVAAGLWAFYVLIYQETIKPAADPVSITLTLTYIDSVAMRRATFCALTSACVTAKRPNSTLRPTATISGACVTIHEPSSATSAADSSNSTAMQFRCGRNSSRVSRTGQRHSDLRRVTSHSFMSTTVTWGKFHESAFISAANPTCAYLEAFLLSDAIKPIVTSASAVMIAIAKATVMLLLGPRHSLSRISTS